MRRPRYDADWNCVRCGEPFYSPHAIGCKLSDDDSLSKHERVIKKSSLEITSKRNITEQKALEMQRLNETERVTCGDCLRPSCAGCV